MVFNDGTFGWAVEIWIHEYYPASLAGNDGLMELLRDIFWPQSLYTGKFNAFCQLSWIFCLLGISGLCFCKRKQSGEGVWPGGNYVVLVVSFLGIFCYQMLFEARAVCGQGSPMDREEDSG